VADLDYVTFVFSRDIDQFLDDELINGNF